MERQLVTKPGTQEAKTNDYRPSSLSHEPHFQVRGLLHSRKNLSNQPKLYPAKLQTKLEVSQPEDSYEQETYQVNEQVVRIPEPSVSSIEFSKIPIFPDQVQRKCSNSCKQKPDFHSSGSFGNRIPQPQRNTDNQAVQRSIKSGALQAKLRVSQPNDIYEQEADRIAEQVMRMPDPAIQKKHKCPLRSDAACNEDKIDRQVVMRKDAGDRIRQSSPQDYILFRQPVPTNPDPSATPKSYDEKSAPVSALPLIHRLVYHKDTNLYTDQVTGELFSREKLEDYAEKARVLIITYRTVVCILSRKLKELQDNPAGQKPGKLSNNYVSEAFSEAENIPFVLTSDKIGGSTISDEDPNKNNICHIVMPETEENPFFVFPFWQHERSHQKTCLLTIDRLYEEFRKQETSRIGAMFNSKGEYNHPDFLKQQKERAKEEVAHQYSYDPIFFINDEIKSYSITINELEKELNAFFSGAINTVAKGPMSLPETYSIHRKVALDQSESLLNPQTSASADIHDVLRSSGQPLDTQTRVFFESRFGYDFSNVRIHTDPKAAESARAVDAQAYTVGNDIAFGEQKYSTGTGEGRQLLAHELTHVVQQEATHKTQEQEQRCSNSLKINPAFNSSWSSAVDREVQRFVESGALQTKLKISQLGDSYGKQSDRVVEQLFRMPNPVQISGEKVDSRIGGTTSETKLPYTINDVRKSLSDFNLGPTKGSDVVQSLDTGGWRIFFWSADRKADRKIGHTDSSSKLILLPENVNLLTNVSTLFHEAMHATRPVLAAGSRKTDPSDPEAVWLNLEEEVMAQYQQILFLKAHSLSTPTLARESFFRDDWPKIENMNREELYHYFREEAIPWIILGKFMEYKYVLGTFKNDIPKMANSPRVTYILNRVILGLSPEISPPKPSRPTFPPLIHPRESFNQEALDSVKQL